MSLVNVGCFCRLWDRVDVEWLVVFVYHPSWVEFTVWLDREGRWVSTFLSWQRKQRPQGQPSPPPLVQRHICSRQTFISQYINSGRTTCSSLIKTYVPIRLLHWFFWFDSKALTTTEAWGCMLQFACLSVYICCSIHDSVLICNQSQSGYMPRPSSELPKGKLDTSVLQIMLLCFSCWHCSLCNAANELNNSFFQIKAAFIHRDKWAKSHSFVM